ncbi:MAG: acyl-CoA dehydratase activase [Desulfobacterales bacterium]|nr:acyl-CoA dehydratase activase [Desulfobacterales bacterium]
MTLSAGCDVGSLTTKVVLMRRRRILAASVIRSRVKPQAAAEQALQQALDDAGAARGDIAACVGTGYGRDRIGFVHATRSEIACHGRGAAWLLPSARTVIDIGGQDCKAMRIDKQGRVEKFLTNDKCASGTGRFLEVMARVLGVDIAALGDLTRASRTPVRLASTCTVWAQADVIKHLNSGIPVADIGAGVNTAMAHRVAILVNAVKPDGDVVMTGGVAKNAGVLATLEKLLDRRIRKVRKADPQLAGAIGAALLAEDNLKEGN